MTYKIGCDIGGTNIDLVMIDQQQKIISFSKQLTGKSVLKNLLLNHSKSADAIHIGSTIAINALLEANELQRVGIIRMIGYGDQLLPPAFDWPILQKNAMIAGCIYVPGGFECDGKIIAQPNRSSIKNAVDQLIQLGAESFAIVSPFSPLYPEHELLAQLWLKEYLGDVYPITLSKDLGNIGFIERENSTIINSALISLFQNYFQDFSNDFNCPIYLTQNYGALMSLEEALKFPIKTIAAGPSNSFIGAAHLASEENAIVIDIGGTSSDCGVVLQQFPKRSYDLIELSGIRLNFPMPELISLPIGGGTIIHDNLTLGPESIAADLLLKASSFGGNIHTLTDSALALNYFSLPQQKIVLEKNRAKKTYQNAMDQLLTATQFMRKRYRDLPIICVGGGANLLSQYILKQVKVPDYFHVANAYGAASAKFSVEIDQVISLQNKKNDLEKIRTNAFDQLIQKGIKIENIRIVHEAILPFYYSPNHLARVTLIAQG